MIQIYEWNDLFFDRPKSLPVIEKHKNKERDIENKTPQCSPISIIFFLIYMSRVFNKVSQTIFLVMSLSFNNELKFIALGSSVKEKIKSFGKFAHIVF